jgi:hypothetical protein
VVEGPEDVGGARGVEPGGERALGETASGGLDFPGVTLIAAGRRA